MYSCSKPKQSLLGSFTFVILSKFY